MVPFGAERQFSLFALVLLLLVPTAAQAQAGRYELRGEHVSLGAFRLDLWVDRTRRDDRFFVRATYDFASGARSVLEGVARPDGEGGFNVDVLSGANTGIARRIAGEELGTTELTSLWLRLAPNETVVSTRGPFGESQASGLRSRAATVAQPAQPTRQLESARAGQGWSRSRDLTPERARELQSWLAQRGETGQFTGAGGKQIGYGVFRAPPGEERAAIVFSVGRTESFWKYAELVHDFEGRGYSFFFVDHRGQGTSERLLGSGQPVTSRQAQKGHVEDFDDYVRDLHTFVTQIVRPTEHAVVFGWGHSLGGAILARYLQEHPGNLRAVVFNAPMFKLPLNQAELLVVRGAVGLGQRRSYALGEGPWSAEPERGQGKGKGRDKPQANDMSTNPYTRSPERWAAQRNLWLQRPELTLGGVTWGWLRQADEATRKIRQGASKIDVPALLFQAEADTTVNNAGQDLVAEKAPRLEKVIVPRGRHELLMGSDPVRDLVLTRALAFFREHEGQAVRAGAGRYRAKRAAAPAGDGLPLPFPRARH